MKLLVVEDEPRIASFLAKGQRAHGYDVEQASTGREALEFGVEPGLSLVILDLRLPDLDGLDVLSSLRGSGATVPVVILSALGRAEDRVRVLDLGADDYLAKPFAFEELLARVRARLRPGTAAPTAMFRAGNIDLNVLTREATSGGRKEHRPRYTHSAGHAARSAGFANSLLAWQDRKRPIRKPPPRTAKRETETPRRPWASKAVR